MMMMTMTTVKTAMLKLKLKRIVLLAAATVVGSSGG